MITINNISKKYKNKIVLDGISFSAVSGDCIGILGENGCGKSTLLSIMAGTISSDKGEISYDSNYGIGYVPQENPLIQELSVKDNLRLWYGKTIPPIVSELGLSDVLNQTVSSLSGGMKKRLSIIIAMAENPDILLLDEPSSALDLPCKQIIREYIQNFCKDGGITIIATHDEMELEICNKLLTIVNGRCKQIPLSLRGKELIKELSAKEN